MLKTILSNSRLTISKRGLSSSSRSISSFSVPSSFSLNSYFKSSSTTSSTLLSTKSFSSSIQNSIISFKSSSRSLSTLPQETTSEPEAVEEVKEVETAGEVNNDRSQTGEVPEGCEEAKQIWVGQLNWGIDNESLAEIFSEYGNVVEARVLTDRMSGRSRGFGFVTFETHSQAVSAWKGAAGKEVEGRRLNTDLTVPRPPRDPSSFGGGRVGGGEARPFNSQRSDPSKTLFVGNLSFHVSEENLSELFGEFGEITSIKIPKDRESGRPRGVGFVEFNSKDEAIKAAEALNGEEIDGRNVRLEFATGRTEGGRGGGGRGGFGGDRGGRGGGGRDRGSFRNSSEGSNWN